MRRAAFNFAENRVRTLISPFNEIKKKHQIGYDFHTMSSFEFDPAKSETNSTEHSIDFVEAQRLWDDSMLLEAPAKTEDEPRHLVIGLIDGKHWSAVITYRGTQIRLISVRRARTGEVAPYES